MQELAEGVAAWAIPWPCLYEFFAIVTHPKIYAPPSTTKQGARSSRRLARLAQRHSPCRGRPPLGDAARPDRQRPYRRLARARRPHCSTLHRPCRSRTLDRRSRLWRVRCWKRGTRLLPRRERARQRLDKGEVQYLWKRPRAGQVWRRLMGAPLRVLAGHHNLSQCLLRPFFRAF
jgi:hypothetical protein